MSLLDIIRSRRSVRSYKSDPLTDEQIKAILEAGMMAPSAHNRQPWNFIVITNREVIDRLSMSAQEYLKDNGVMRKTKFEKDVDTIFYGAPCVVLVVVEKGNEEGVLHSQNSLNDGARNSSSPCAYAPIDCGMASQNMALYAREQGIASCVIGYARHVAHEELIAAGMKDSQELMFGMVFGYSDQMGGEVNRDFNKVQKWLK